MLWYMRDDFTFVALPHNIDAAIEVLRSQFTKGATYGMLCSDYGKPSRPMEIDPNAHARNDFAEFEPRARIWLAQELGYKSPADIEYESWGT